MRTTHTLAALAAAALLAVSLGTAPAEAGGRRGCHDCQPASKTIVKTNYRYNTVHQVNRVTQYRDVMQVRNVTQVRDVVRPTYVDIVHRTVNVTRVVPVTHVDVVTRVHPVTRVNTVTRVRDVTYYQQRHETVGQTVYAGGRTVYGHSSMMMPARMERGGHAHVHGGRGHAWTYCNC